MKKCNQCLGEIPEKARKCQHCGTKIKITWKELTLKEKIVAVVLGVIIAFVVISFFTGNDLNTPTASTKTSLRIGEEGIIHRDGVQKILISIDEVSMEESMKAFMAEDWQGIMELISSGRAFQVNNDTRVKVIDRNIGGRKVRILEGEMHGKSGWISMEFVKKL